MFTTGLAFASGGKNQGTTGQGTTSTGTTSQGARHTKSNWKVI